MVYLSTEIRDQRPRNEGSVGSGSHTFFLANVSSANLVVHQDNIPRLIIFFILISCLLKKVLILLGDIIY